MKIEKSTIIIVIGIASFMVTGFFIPHNPTIKEALGFSILISSGILIGYGLGLSNKEEA